MNSLFQVNIDLDEKLGDLLSDGEAKKEPDKVGTAVKQEQNEEAFSIYISSDSDSEDVTPGPILHGKGEYRTQDLAASSVTVPVQNNSSIVPTTASTRASVWRQG